MTASSILKRILWVSIAACGVMVGSLLVLYIAPSRLPAEREDIILARSDLASNIPGQPLPPRSDAIIDVIAGHAPGHVLVTKPKTLPPGEYVLTMNIEVTGGVDRGTPSCIMDLLAEDVLISNVPVQGYETELNLSFRSPDTKGASSFVTRMFCDGRMTLQIFDVAFVRNPDALPRVIYQQ